MPRHGENIYKRRDGRYEGRYVVGKTATGKTKFGYVYGYQYTEVRNELLRKKTERLPVGETMLKCRRILLRDWLQQWLESEVSGSVKDSSYQTYLKYLCQEDIYAKNYLTTVLEEHRLIFKAFTEKDVEAGAEAMEQHISTSKKRRCK